MRPNPDHEQDVPPTTATISRRALLAALGGGALLARRVDAWGAAVPEPPPSAAPAWHYDTLADVARRIEAKELSPVELTRHMLDRIAALDGRLHGYVTVMADDAMTSARQAEGEIRAGRYRGALHGIPIGVKDLCFTRGVRTMAGTMVLADFVPTFDATVVAKLREAGAVILGKVTLCEGAMAPYHPLLQVPVNPWDDTRWSGVSSSGSGVATAAGLCFGSIGTDTGGSIRYPSAVNGCVGLKPTYGRVSRYGVHALAESMDHIGPMTRSVEDAAIMLEVMAGYDANDPTSLRDPVPPIRAQLSEGIAGLRIGIDRRYAMENVDEDVVRALEAVLAVLADRGARIVDVTMPDVSKVNEGWWEIATAEAAAYHAATYPSRATEYGEGLRAVLAYGRKVSGVTYANAAKVRAEFNGRLYGMLAGVDCIVCPSLSNSARPKLPDPFRAEEDADWGTLVRNDAHTKPFNFAGSPTLSVPCGFSSDGLPLSVQFVGRALSEATLCRVGHAFERATTWHLRHPPLP